MSRLVAFHRRLCLEGPRNLPERLLAVVLWPAGWIYGFIGWVRAGLYARGLLPSYRAPVPVIAVGNLTAGGTGKTPVVDYLVRRLLEQGLRVAVISRGYGGRGIRDAVVVSAGDGPQVQPDLCGDEPFLLARRNPAARVVVAPKRALGAQLAVEQLGAQILVLDDGFQHLAVQRDLNIVLLDAASPLGNGRPLPAGLLREFPVALTRGHLFILTRWREDCSPPPPLPGPVLRSRHVIADLAHDLAGNQLPLKDLRGKRAVAFAGIAAPEGFFRDLRQFGLTLLKTLPLADHVVYDDQIVRQLYEASENADILLTTEKDAVKLRAGQLTRPCWQVPMTLEFLETAALDQALGQLRERIR